MAKVRNSYRMTREREREILSAYRRWRSIRTAAYVTGSGLATVRRIAKSAGMLRPRGRPKVELPTAARLLELRQKLGTFAAIADIYGCNVKTIVNRIRGRS